MHRDGPVRFDTSSLSLSDQSRGSVECAQCFSPKSRLSGREYAGRLAPVQPLRLQTPNRWVRSPPPRRPRSSLSLARFWGVCCVGGSSWGDSVDRAHLLDRMNGVPLARAIFTSPAPPPDSRSHKYFSFALVARFTRVLVIRADLWPETVEKTVAREG